MKSEELAQRRLPGPEELKNDPVNSAEKTVPTRLPKPRRKCLRKKKSKIIHTFCIVRKTPDGKKHVRFVHKTRETELDDPSAIRKEALAEHKQQQSDYIAQNAGNAFQMAAPARPEPYTWVWVWVPYPLMTQTIPY